MANFLSLGFAELGRKIDRLKLRRRLAGHEQERSAALATLGQRAWEQRLDLAAFPALRDRLAGLDAKAGELAQTSATLRQQEEQLKGERATEAAKFDARRKEIEKRREPVAAALRESGAKKAEAEKAMQRGSSRIPAIETQLTALEKEIATLVAGDPKRTAAEEKRVALTAERETTRAAMEAARADLPAITSRNDELSAQDKAIAQELATAITEERAALAKLDESLSKTRTELQGTQRSSTAVQGERLAAFTELGATLYSARTYASVLTSEFERVQGIDQARDATSGAAEASLSETRALPPNTMLKFWGVVAGVPLLAVILVVAYKGWERQQTAPRAAAAAPADDFEAERTRKVERFLREGRRDEKLHAEAVHILRNDIYVLGGTANPAHLPTLAALLKSEEPELRASAAQAMSMIGPTKAETAALIAAMSDPNPNVAQAARRALADSFDVEGRVAAHATADRK